MPDSSPFKHAKADDSAGFLLWKMTALWQGKLAEKLGAFGITQTQYAILASLKWFEEQEEPTTQTHIAEHARIDKMTLSKAIRKLEEEGLLIREHSTSDSRAINVQFTAKGKKLVQKAIVTIEKADDDFFSCLTERQLETFQSLTLSLIASNA